MATTALFAELLIIGMQGVAWIALLALILFGDESVGSVVEAMVAKEALAAIIALGVFYSVGVVLDRVYQGLAVLLNLPRRLKRLPGMKSRSTGEHPVSTLVEVYREAGILTSYFQYLVGRCRIARATFFNLATIWICGLIYILVRHDPFSSVRSGFLFAAVLLGAAVFLISSLVSYGSLLGTLRVRAKQILPAGSPGRGQEQEWSCPASPDGYDLTIRRPLDGTSFRS